uniref:Uncharacterized protein n=1 Tax=Caenorhabditis japonica TaxID=281687 RepID=A0A8R1EQ19_CAEJA
SDETHVNDDGDDVTADVTIRLWRPTVSRYDDVIFRICDDSETRTKSRMEKYFAEKPDKNIFMKLIHPSYHERNLQFKKIFVDKGLVDESDQFLA